MLSELCVAESNRQFDNEIIKNTQNETNTSDFGLFNNANVTG